MEPHAHATVETDAPPSCQNCQATLPGPYCGSCGQRALHLDVSLRELLHEGVREFMDVDGRILTTLRLLLTRPGRLTSEMLAGRRQRYIAPIRLYLVCSVVFFLMLSWLVPIPRPVPASELARDRNLATSPTERGFKLDLKQGTARVLGDPAVFIKQVLTTAPKAAFVLVPAFALLTMATFRRRVRFFVPHLYFALHVHSALFLAMAALLLIGRWTGPSIAGTAALCLPLLYLVSAVRETFAVDLGEALWKSLLVLLAYTLTLAIALTGVLVLSIMFP